MMNDTKEVFISYHMDSSTDIVEKISAALEGVGISSWYAKQDIAGGYAGAIVDAISDCKVFLLILNQYSSMSAHCLNEISIVFDRLSKRENVVILPFKIDKCELSKDAYYYLGRMRMFDGSLPPEMERVGELVDRITAILGKNSCVEGSVVDSEAKTSRSYRIVGSTISKSSNFIGRKKELEEIHQRLSDHPNKLFLVGMGGIGKSEIAKAYCDTYRSSYDVILWVSYDTSLEKTLVNDFAFPIQGIERADYSNEDDHAYFLRKLKILKEITDQKVLLIVDNFDVFEDPDLEEFCRGAYTVLFTTRYHEVCNDVPEIEIHEITDEAELLELFQTEYKKELDAGALAQVKELLAVLNGHPLSIRLVASAMKSNRISPEKMLAMLKDSSEELKQKKTKAMDMIFDRLKQVFAVASLSKEEQDILKNLVLTPLSGIDVETFYEWGGFEDYDLIDELIRKSWVVHDYASDEVHLHPLITDVMTEELKKDMDCCNTFLDSIKEGTRVMSRFPYVMRKKYFACLRSASQKLPDSHPGRWAILWGYGKMVFEYVGYDSGMDIMRELIAQTDDLTSLLMAYNVISHGYVLTGRSEESMEEAQRGLKLIEGIPLDHLTPEQRAERRGLVTRLAEVHRNLGTYEIAEDIMRSLIDETKQFPDDATHTDLGWSYLHLARILSYKNTEADWRESEAFFEEGLRIFKKARNTVSEGYIYMFYGQLRMFEGKFEEAFRMQKLAVELIGPGIGEQHVGMAKLQMFEANIWRAKGDEEQAIKCYTKAIQMMYQRNNAMLAEKIQEILDSGNVGYTN